MHFQGFSFFFFFLVGRDFFFSRKEQTEFFVCLVHPNKNVFPKPGPIRRDWLGQMGHSNIWRQSHNHSDHLNKGFDPHPPQPRPPLPQKNPTLIFWSKNPTLKWQRCWEKKNKFLTKKINSLRFLWLDARCLTPITNFVVSFMN